MNETEIAEVAETSAALRLTDEAFTRSSTKSSKYLVVRKVQAVDAAVDTRTTVRCIVHVRVSY